MMPLSSFNIVLDLDDTLYLEIDYVKSGFQAIDAWLKNSYAITGFFEMAWSLFCENPKNPIIDLTFQSLSILPELEKKALSIYRKHTPTIFLLEDATTFLNHYKNDTLFLITDGRPEGQKAKIDALKITSYFKKIFITGEWGTEYFKPHPRAFASVNEFSEKPSIYIADNPLKDFIAPHQLGWLPSIRIKREKSLHSNLPTPEGCYEVNSLSEAIHILDQLK